MRSVKRKLHKNLKLAVGFTAVAGSCYIFMLFTHDGQENSKGGESLPFNSTECTERLGRSPNEDLQKINSYRFPSAKPFLNRLLPLNFKLENPSQFIRQNHLDQSLPSLPALVTAFSANHLTEAMELIENTNTVRSTYKDMKFYIFDLGLSSSQKKKVIRECRCEVIDFPFHEFPDHIRNLRAYCWKPLAIQMILKFHRFVIWMDASIRFLTKDLDQMFRDARTLGVQAAVGFAPIAARTSNKTFQFLGESPCLFRQINEFEATFIMIYANDFIMQHVMVPWVSCALTEQCMAPVSLIGCRNDHIYFDCHRFDQSVLSILLARLFHGDIKAHTLQHTTFQICKNGYENPFLPTIVNKYLNNFYQNCF